MKKLTIKIRNGNSKIGKDTFILNITSATDCPTKQLGLCKIPNICYALHPEIRWTGVKNVLTFRREQTKLFDSHTSKEIAEQIISSSKNKHRKEKIKYLRIHESGDFRNQEDVTKISEIAELLKKENIRVYGYSARSDLDYTNVSDNLILNGSYFTIHNQFKPVSKYSEGSIRCIGNCSICNLCKEKSGISIENEFHGVKFQHKKEKNDGEEKGNRMLEVRKEGEIYL